MPVLKLVHGLPKIPKAWKIADIDVTGAPPRVKAGESVLVDNEPLTRGDEVVFVDRQHILRLAIWNGFRRGRDRLTRLDGIAWAVQPLAMRRVVGIVFESNNDTPALS